MELKIGDKIRIIKMEGEPQYSGKVGVVEYIDDIGQIHGTWGGLAIQLEHDFIEIIEQQKGGRNAPKNYGGKR